jgi:hypothetical protein
MLFSTQSCGVSLQGVLAELALRLAVTLFTRREL